VRTLPSFDLLQENDLSASRELAITSTRELEPILSRHIFREQMSEEKIKGDIVSRGTPLSSS
jgi:hypothetical protein